MGARKPTRLVTISTRSKKGNQGDSLIYPVGVTSGQQEAQQSEVVEKVALALLPIRQASHRTSALDLGINVSWRMDSGCDHQAPNVDSKVLISESGGMAFCQSVRGSRLTAQYNSTTTGAPVLDHQDL